MESLGKQAGYLKGLLDGIEEQSMPQAKLMQGIVSLLGALCDRADAVDEMLSELNDYVESIDDDLTELEGNRDDQDFDEDEDYDLEAFAAAPKFGDDKLRLLPVENEEESALAGGICPECSGMFFIEGADDARYVCPHCGKAVRIVPLTSENAPIGQPAEE